MLFLLSKTLLFLIKPLIWAIVLFIASVFSKLQHNKRLFFRLGLIIILFFSNSVIVGKIMNLYEAKYPPISKYDVGILLGGYANLNKRNDRVQFGWATDRFNQTILLYKQGVIKKILITGGNANLIDKKIKESDLVIEYLKKIGVPDSSVIIENQSRNTIENAELSFNLINHNFTKSKVLIITSAWHIPRAKVAFDKYFKDADYYPTNFIGKTKYDFADFVIPSTEALNNWELLMKEWIGLVVDKFRN